MAMNHEQKSELFQQLARLDKTGIPPDQAFGLVLADQKGEEQETLKRMLRFLKRGQALAQAGKTARLFNNYEAALISAASQTGEVWPAYQKLADFYYHRARRIKRIRSGLSLPGLVTGIAIFVQPLPDLVIGRLSPLGYLGNTVGVLAGMAALYFTLKALLHMLRDPEARSRAFMDRLSLAIPVFGPVNRQRNQQTFLEILANLEAAGIPILQALPIAVSALQNSIVQNDYEAIATRISDRGSSFAQALSACRYIDRNVVMQLNVGEQSGRQADTLEQLAQTEAEKLQQFDDQVATWLPRIVYGLVCLGMIRGLLA